MKNSLYQLIDEWYDFMKLEFILFLKTSLSNENYYMLVPRNRERVKISTEKGELIAIGYHITIYNQVKKDVLNSTFHITISLIDENKNCYVARIFYDGFGKYLFSTIKDKDNIPVDIGPQYNLLKFGDNNIFLFVNMILDLKKDYHERYQYLADLTNQLNKDLVNITEPRLLRKKLLNYQKGLQDLISHIESGTMFNQAHLADLGLYENFLGKTELELSFLAAKTADHKVIENVVMDSKVVLIQPSELSPVEMVPEVIATQSEAVDAITYPEPSSNIVACSKSRAKPTVKEAGASDIRRKIDEINKEITAIFRSKNISPFERVSREYELLNKKMALLQKGSGKKNKKSTIKKSEDEIFDTMIRFNQLQEEINSIVLNFLNDEAAYKGIEKLSMGDLLQNCTLKTEYLVELTVKNNRVEALTRLMLLRKDVNLEMKTKGEKLSLLEIAYNTGHFEMLKFLLAHKVSPNTVCANKKSLLYSACIDGRAKEMEALLEAKANPLTTDSSGFAPLATFLMRTDKQRINIPMAKVFLAYAPQAIDQLQGKRGFETTPLAYACQEDLWDVAELLLRFGADLNKVRNDGLTPLGVCVYKDNFALFKYVVENSTIPIREALFNALDLAVISDKQQFIEYIMQYSDDHQLNLSVPIADDAKKRFVKHKHSSAAVISVGTSLTSFFFRSLYSDDSDDENSALVITLSG